MTGITHPHVDPLPILLVEETHDGKSDIDIVKLNLCKDPISPTLELYELKISLFDNGDPEEFLLFVRNFNMTLAASGKLDAIPSYSYPLKSVESV